MASSTDTTDILKCPICLEVYNKPKYLPCLHTFCEPCLKSYIVASVKQNEGDAKTKVEFNCPICRVIVPVADPSTPPEEWASQYCNNHLIMTLMDKQKLESNVKLCDPCQVDSNDVTAVSWCKICNEALCEFCATFHRKMVATKQHELFLISEQEKSSFDITRHEFCETHKDKQLEAFCFDHNQACCVTCVTINHRKCDHVTTLDDAAKDVRDTRELKEICDRLLETEKVLSTILKATKDNFSDLQRQKLIMLNQVSELRIQIDSHLSRIETKLVQQINDLNKQHVAEITDTLFDLENRQKIFGNYHKVFSESVKQATDTHLFLEMKRLEDKQKEMEAYLRSSLENLHKIDCTLTLLSEFSKQILKTESLGTIDVQRRSIKECLSSEEVFHLSMLLDRSIFSKCYSFTIPNTNIKDAVLLPDGRMAITTGNIIRFCEESGNNMTKMRIVGATQLYGLEIFNENEILIACPTSACIHVVNFYNKKNIKRFEMAFGYVCNGITILSDYIITACQSQLVFMNFRGEIVKKINVQTTVDNITSSKQKLFYTNSETQTLHCVTFEGRSVFEYKHPELQGPCGVTTDEEGFILVAGYNSSNIHQVSPKGEHVKIILTQDDGIKYPHAVCFDRMNKKLIVAHSSCKIDVYEKQPYIV